MIDIVCGVENPRDVATLTSSLNNVEKISGHARNKEVPWGNIGPTSGSTKKKKRKKKGGCSTIPTIFATIDVINNGT